MAPLCSPASRSRAPARGCEPAPRRLRLRPRRGALALLLFAAIAPLDAADLSADQVASALARASAEQPALFDGRDLSDLDLSRLDFRHASLRGSNLFASRLVSSNFSGTDLRGANLNGAWLMGADFTGARLAGASLLSVVILGGEVKAMPIFQIGRAHV